MIHRLSEKIAFLFCEKKIINNNMKEVYAYGLELLIATLLTGSILFGLSIVLGIFRKTILLLIPFIIIRSKAGGYHAKTHFGCMLSFISTYLLSAWLLNIMLADSYAIFSTVSLIASFITVLSLGSIPNENRPVTPVEKKGFDKNCKFLSFVLTATGFVLMLFIPKFGIYFAAGILMAAGSMIIEKLKLLRRDKNEYSQKISRYHNE